jgi:Phage integrase, N-terminal SAM-like domain
MPQAPRPKELLDQMRDILRTPHDAIRTEHAYVDWARRFILFHQKRHPTAMGWVAIAALLTHLAVDRHRAASTHNQALSALLLLSKAVLRQDGGGGGCGPRAEAHTPVLNRGAKAVRSPLD